MDQTDVRDHSQQAGGAYPPGAYADSGAVVQQERSLGELFGDLTRQFSTLMREEVQLAKAEIKEEATKAGKAGGMFGGAAVAGYFCLLLLSFAAAWGLTEVVPEGVAFLIIGVIWGAVAAVLYFKGRDEMKNINPMPAETVETLKEDAQWAKAQLK